MFEMFDCHILSDWHLTPLHGQLAQPCAQPLSGLKQSYTQDTQGGGLFVMCEYN